MKRFDVWVHLVVMGAPTSEVAVAELDFARAVAGDEAAFAQIVQAHHRDLAAVAFVITGDRSLAQDAVQSAWMIAWRKLSSVREPAKVRSWLLRVTANEARQIVRGRRAVVEITPDLADNVRRDPAAGIDRIDLANAMRRLSPDDRALLAYRYVAGLDAVELGALTNRSASGIRTRLSRLTARLRRELDNA